MVYERTEGIVSRKVDFSETSRIVTFLTPDRGRLACIAKGARRKGSPMLTSLDTCNRVELTYFWKDGRQVQTLTEVSVIDAYTPIKRNVDMLAAASFILDVAHHAHCENHAAPELHQALIAGLDMLAGKQHTPGTCAATAVFALLCASGVAPHIGNEESVAWSQKCGQRDTKRIVKELETLAREGRPLDPPGIRAILDFLHDYAVCHFETTLKSYSFLRSLLE